MSEKSILFTIIHTDDQVVVVNKASGLLTTPAYGAPCLVDLLEAELDRQRFGRYRLAVVHRLDRETSGLVVMARTPRAAAALAKQFAAHRVEREYVAIVSGQISEEQGTITSPVQDKRATTHFEVLERSSVATMIKVRLETGRRNQIRVHFSLRGQPLIGDLRFGALPDPDWTLTRVALHARVLGFVHPLTRQTLHFEAELPVEMRNYLEVKTLHDNRR